MSQSSIEIVENDIDNLFEGKGWDHYDTELGDVNWPIEEASWLRIVPDKQILTDESGLFLKFLENTNIIKIPKNRDAYAILSPEKYIIVIIRESIINIVKYRICV